MSKSQFDMLKVNLYTSGSVDTEGNGGWATRLHCIIRDQHYTKTIGGYAKDTTITRMTLQAVLNGLLQLKKNKPVFVHIYTSVVQVSSGLNKHMYNWFVNNWNTTNGEPPLHVDLWRQIHAILTDKTRVLAYKVHRQNITNDYQADRLSVIHSSSEFLLKGKRDLYEVQLV